MTSTDGADEPGKRVLVVDDSEAIRNLIVVNLQLEGYDVRSAGDGQEALDLLAASRPAWRPDVVTVDVVMPRLDGFATVEALRADPETADVPVLMLTARSGDADRERADLAGVDAFLTKPFEPADLVGTVARLAAGHRPISG